MKLSEIKPVFCEFIPEVLESGLIYISEEYASSVHLCACGCGEKTVLPLGNPDDGVKWSLVRAGEFVSLTPSIGNWKYPCQSHYYITANKIVWC